MGKYIVKRVIMLIPVIIGVSLLIFIMIHPLSTISEYS